jgi:acyl dehydratase
MAINPVELKSRLFPPYQHTYGVLDTILYALSTGAGSDPLDECDLRFVYEDRLEALPTMVNVLGVECSWLRKLDIGIDYTNVVHGEHGFTIHRPLPPSGTLVSTLRITEVLDKGKDKGALIVFERDLVEAHSGDMIATVRHATFARADGGFGSESRSRQPPPQTPTRPADIRSEFTTKPSTALLFRLNGDRNPLHVDPSAARKAGFERPPLHGLATFAVAGNAILKHVCGNQVSRLAAMSGRFSASVFPGETILTEIWVDGVVVDYRATVVGRTAPAITNGRATLRG